MPPVSLPLKIELVNFWQKQAEIQAVRQSVFQLEQGIDPALDWDGQDETAQHLIATLQGKPVGTARLRSLENQIAKVERLAVLPQHRGQGIGRQIMVAALDYLTQQAISVVILHAQVQTEKFYRQLGFEPQGEIFFEAGIPHRKMSQKFKNSTP